MFIAFEGPDNVGKSTTAAKLDCAAQPGYNVTKAMHAQDVADWQGDKLMPRTYDRIDWFTHMIYRLALPTREWNDDRPRTVFAMPDTHLVVMVHRQDLANFTAEEVVDTPVAQVNPMYYYFADYFMDLNAGRAYTLFKSVTILEVVNKPSEYRFRVMQHDSPTLDEAHALARLVRDPNTLLDFLQHVEQSIG